MKTRTPEVISQYLHGRVPEGFQRTFFGVAPPTWNKAKVSDICRLSSGSTPRRDNPLSYQGSIPWVTSGELKRKYIFDTQEKITPLAARESHLELYGPGTVVIAIYGLEAEGVRGTASIVGKRCAISQACMAFSHFKGVDNEFFYYWYLLHGPIIGGRFAQGTKQQNLSAEIVGFLPISFPGRQAQRKIAKILSTQDKIIDLWNRKIEQLRQLKKLCLRKMFPRGGSDVPEVRFPGFTGAWKRRRLSDIADIIGGGTPNTTVTTYWDGNIDWYTPAEISDQIFVDSSQRKISSDGLMHSAAKLLPVGSVLFTSRAGIGKGAILAKEGCTNQGFQSLVPHKNTLDSYFIFSRLAELKRYGEVVGKGSTFLEVSGTQMARMELMMPSTMEEQIKIGKFFRKFDSLISLHQRRLAAEEEKKKALMQLLLTGIVRV